MSVATLPSMPRAKGPFHRAIVQSRTAHNVTVPSTAERLAGSSQRRWASRPPGTRSPRFPERLLQAQAQLRDDLLARPDQIGVRSHSATAAGPRLRLGTKPLHGRDPPQSLATVKRSWGTPRQRAILFSPRAFPGPTQGIVRAVYGWPATFMRLT
jgi:carboxylesterase type B